MTTGASVQKFVCLFVCFFPQQKSQNETRKPSEDDDESGGGGGGDKAHVLNRKVSATYGVRTIACFEWVLIRPTTIQFVPGDLKRREKKKEEEDVQSYTTMPPGATYANTFSGGSTTSEYAVCCGVMLIF